jgi:hypothetical protein
MRDHCLQCAQPLYVQRRALPQDARAPTHWTRAQASTAFEASPLTSLPLSPPAHKNTPTRQRFQCELYKAGFKEEVTLHVGADGSVLGLDYTAPQGPLSATRDCARARLPATVTFTTTVRTAAPAPAQV